MNYNSPEWRAIARYSGLYEVSDDCRVRSVKHGRELSQSLTSGYPTVRLYANDGGKTHRVHVLVCTAWHGEKPFTNAQVRHLNGCRTDNRPANLAWGSPADDLADRKRHGRVLRGEACSWAKLSESDVRNIRNLWPEVSKYRLAADYGVSWSTVDKIIQRKTWVGREPTP